MTVSVVIPLCNKGRYIERAVESVLEQSVRDIEVIVVDDGSTDGGPDVVRRMRDPRIRLAVQGNAGASVARNNGARLSSSDLISFLDADDVWESDFLATVLALRTQFPQAALWGTAYRVVSRSGYVEQPAYHGRLPAGGEGGLIDYFTGKTGRSPLCASAVLVRKDALEMAGGFPVGVAYGEDHDTWLRLALRYPLAWTPHPKALLYEDAEDRTGDFLYLGNYPFFKSVRGFLDEPGHDRPLPDEVYSYVARRHTELLFSKWLAGERAVLHEIVRDCRHVKGYELTCRLWYLLSWVPHPLVVFAWRTHRRLKGRSGRWPQVRRIQRSQTRSHASGLDGEMQTVTAENRGGANGNQGDTEH